jgi:hypothetical protein
MDLQAFDLNDLWLIHDGMTQRRIEFNKLNCTGGVHREFQQLMVERHLAIMQEIIKRNNTGE